MTLLIIIIVVFVICILYWALLTIAKYTISDYQHFQYICYFSRWTFFKYRNIPPKNSYTSNTRAPNCKQFVTPLNCKGSDCLLKKVGTYVRLNIDIIFSIFILMAQSHARTSIVLPPPLLRNRNGKRQYH